MLRKLVVYPLAATYVAFCYWLVVIGDVNAIPFNLYMLLCFSIENERLQRALAEKISKMTLRWIFVADILAITVSAFSSVGCHFVPGSGEVLTVATLFLLGLSANGKLQEMANEINMEIAKEAGYREFFVLSSLVIALIMGGLSLMIDVCVNYSSETVWYIPLSFITTLGGLLFLKLMNDEVKDFESGWDTRHQVFHKK